LFPDKQESLYSIGFEGWDDGAKRHSQQYFSCIK